MCAMAMMLAPNKCVGLLWGLTPAKWIILLYFVPIMFGEKYNI